MKKLFVLLFFISCQTTKAPLIDSSTGVTKTLIPLKDSFLKLYIEVYKSPEETYGYLVSKDFLLDSVYGKVPISVTIGSNTYEYTCPIHIGDQRVSLPNSLVDKIIDSIKEKNRIHIAIEGENAIIEGLEQNLKPIYQDIVERGFDYLDKNVYQ